VTKHNVNRCVCPCTG